mmetsp:Transcript_41517/g.75224  ORF Transcript_41517/g.75224 Transcript_41517/m.75224 type:complete len:114 (+) Transcript_41517:55-396(+)
MRTFFKVVVTQDDAEAGNPRLVSVRAQKASATGKGGFIVTVAATTDTTCLDMLTCMTQKMKSNHYTTPDGVESLVTHQMVTDLSTPIGEIPLDERGWCTVHGEVELPGCCTVM